MLVCVDVSGFFVHYVELWMQIALAPKLCTDC